MSWAHFRDNLKFYHAYVTHQNESCLVKLIIQGSVDYNFQFIGLSLVTPRRKLKNVENVEFKFWRFSLYEEVNADIFFAFVPKQFC